MPVTRLRNVIDQVLGFGYQNVLTRKHTPLGGGGGGQSVSPTSIQGSLFQLARLRYKHNWVLLGIPWMKFHNLMLTICNISRTNLRVGSVVKLVNATRGYLFCLTTASVVCCMEFHVPRWQPNICPCCTSNCLVTKPVSFARMGKAGLTGSLVYEDVSLL